MYETAEPSRCRCLVVSKAKMLLQITEGYLNREPGRVDLDNLFGR